MCIRDSKKRTATEGLLWLLRYVVIFHLQAVDLSLRQRLCAFHWTTRMRSWLQVSLRHMSKRSASTTACWFARSSQYVYSKSANGCVQLAMKACPYRKDFYAKLGPSEDEVRPQLSTWLNALEKIVQDMQQFFEYVQHTNARALTDRRQGQYAKGF